MAEPVPGPRRLVIVGSTASGKSALAMEVADVLGDAELISVDSMQVYRRMDIGTAKPSAIDQQRVPHHLIDVLEPSEDSSAGWVQGLARGVVDDLAQRGRRPIFVGGTGLYFSALVNGISDIPEPEADIRKHWRQKGLENPQTLHVELARRDPEAAAQLRPSDVQRLIRALEVFDSTGKSILQFHRESASQSLLAGARIEAHLVSPARAELHQRINHRFDLMIKAGALGEVEALLARNLPEHLPVMKAIGVPQLAAHVAGKISLETAVERAKAASRQYAKRQSTFFRNQMTHVFDNVPPESGI